MRLSRRLSSRLKLRPKRSTIRTRRRLVEEFASVKNGLSATSRSNGSGKRPKKLADRLRAAAALRISNEAVTPGLTPAARARVFATVNGKNITSADIEDNLKPLIFSVQESVYGLRKQDVEIRINDVLLEQEAKKRAITTTSLLAPK